MSHATFSYDEAFSRNIGWITDWEQQVLRTKKVAIAGMGGVGGGYVLALCRLGIGSLNLSDYDCFELPNFNRQVGAMVSNIGKPKVEVMANMAKEINPELHIKTFGQGVDHSNIDSFLEGVDVFVDAIDAFVIEKRFAIYERCLAKGIPIIISAPLGMAAAYIVFQPGQMSFRDYFQLDGLPAEKQAVNFLLGLAPDLSHTSYLIDLSKVDLKNKRGPSTPIGCILSAGVVATCVLKILTGRGKIYSAPWYHYFDPFLNKWILNKLPGGNKHPLQRIRAFFAYQMVCKDNKSSFATVDVQKYWPNEELKAILDFAKWSPSAENTQPWKFTITDEDNLQIDISDEHSIFIDDYYSKLNVGVFIETLRIAASHYQRKLQWSYKYLPHKVHRLYAYLPKDYGLPRDELFPFLRVRAVNRGGYQIKSLLSHHKEELKATLGSNYTVRWFENFADRLHLARLTAMGTQIRLSMKEGFDANSACLDFKDPFSVDKMPLASLGLSKVTQAFIHWAMQDYQRIRTLNTFFAGAFLPTLELDILPGLRSAGYFMITANSPLNRDEQVQQALEAGQIIQKFWLKATHLGISIHPASGALILAGYGKHNISFTTQRSLVGMAKSLAQDYEKILPLEQIIFMGRIGYPQQLLIKSRAVRKPLESFLVNPQAKV